MENNLNCGTMLVKKCPQCRKTLISQARENPSKYILKIRLLELHKSGGTVAKCRHCGQLVKIPFLHYSQ